MSEARDNIIIGSNIRKYRIAKKLSLKNLAILLGVSYQQIQKYETGVDRVSASKLHKISKHLEVSMDDFFIGI